MKRKTLLLLTLISLVTLTHAQKKGKTQPIEGYAITATEKGSSGWKDVRLVNLLSGEEVKSVYQNSISLDQVELLNARTGKPIEKKEQSSNGYNKVTITTRKVVNLDQALDNDNNKMTDKIRKVVYVGGTRTNSTQPFATNSAACAYDEKHDRLYYTPMSINQLRYIDLKSKTPKIFYFENEAFGVVTGAGDAPAQITRMVMASDGNGYALSNDANHLIRFTTGKDPQITDLGELSDDPANGKYSVHNSGNYGGDIIADASKNIYLVAGNRRVYKFNIDTKIATHLGAIQGLPSGFTTNGAMVEEGSKVIVCSSQSTIGYFRFDLLTLMAEKVTTSEDVYNASDLASANLAFDKKKKKTKKDREFLDETPVVTPVETVVNKPGLPEENTDRSNIAVFPNPVNAGGYVKVSFDNLPAGRYQVQLLDINGQLVSKSEVNVQNKVQSEDFRIPAEVTKGNYLIKIFSEPNKISQTTKLLVQ
ncbi:MAG TPA: T9SS type A sorting domain-containing protein [Chitinophagaceae bacterium]|nr:T9SS type A sorting domain-containing protein [Chitinophagaceae bacterium]